MITGCGSKVIPGNSTCSDRIQILRLQNSTLLNNHHKCSHRRQWKRELCSESRTKGSLGHCHSRETWHSLPNQGVSALQGRPLCGIHCGCSPRMGTPVILMLHTSLHSVLAWLVVVSNCSLPDHKELPLGTRIQDFHQYSARRTGVVEYF